VHTAPQPRPGAGHHHAGEVNLFPNLFLINTGLRKEITESIIEICKHFNVEYLQLKDIGKQAGHPNIVGMEAIAKQVLAVLQP
jgi:hypothetical protein